MKFLTKINRQYFWTLSIVLILISVIGHVVLKSILTNEIKEDIIEKELAIINEIKTQNNIPNIYPIIETQKISKSKVEPKTYKEIFIPNESEDEYEPYLEYTNSVKINNQYYLIKLRHSLLDTDELILAITLPLLLLLISTFLISFFITKKLNKTVWKDFEINLKELENYSFKNLNNLELKQTNIEEFKRLNSTIITLTQKLKNDYQTLKDFTENASHEIQTPISIILLNLEELLQQDLSEQAFKMVLTTINAVKRLSTLNKSLLLLTKIENHQYLETNELNISEYIENKIKEFSSLLETNNISVDFRTNEIFTVKLNPELADILLNNLISNAIKHNINNGKIKIETYNNRLIICNTGQQHSLTNDNIFNRFTKENSKSYGLGLAIVKHICSLHNIDIHYEKNELHCFTLKIFT